jgi:hypothetical protein
MSHTPLDPDTFLARWQGADGSELANYQLFVGDLCRLLDVPMPEPAREDTRDNAYVFERRVHFAHGDGSTSAGRIDCYRRGTFVLEAKKVKLGSHTKGFDDALMRARAQAEGYARALPAAEGRPPFLVVVDVGHVIELYAEFTKSGATYTPFPDARSHRLKLADLRDEAVRNRLRTLWLDPMALDPARASAKVTREVAVQLAALARSLEQSGHGAEPSAAFLTRCLFSMFAEDVGLLPKRKDGQGAFVGLLHEWREDPATLQRMLAVLWTDMDRGGFSVPLAKDVLRFNGKLFKGWQAADFVLPLTRDQIDLLLLAAKSNWREVEPAIFGTLLEWALEPDERHALGAHYTPRAYVERLVLPTVVEPLREDWANAQAVALLLANEANALEGKKRDEKLAEARAEIRRFHHQLCTVRVLDPACGSGNFLYVTLEHLKRLEGEVQGQLEALGETQSKLGFEGETVTLKQLLGIEINERAAALAELVLWIGYLQWHIRTFGHASVAEPVIHDYKNIEHRDAVLAYDGQEPMRDDQGELVTRWDGKTFKVHPATGEKVPDEKAQVVQWRYLNPRPAEWPQADFIIGNPPFIGNKRMREALGDGYVDAIRRVSGDVPDTSDFVMYWWDRAASLVRVGSARRFGLIATNSLRQTFNRPVVQRQLDAKPPLTLRLAIPDHPWVDSATHAAVRISMTVGTNTPVIGELGVVTSEKTIEDGEVEVGVSGKQGVIHADLHIGAAVSGVSPLHANSQICFQGYVLVGEGFLLSKDEKSVVAERAPSEVLAGTRRWKNGRDLSQQDRGMSVIDLYPCTADEARSRFPTLYQHLLDRVKPFRDQVARKGHREKWWLWGEARPGLRRATQGLRRVVVTNFAAKHRYFVFEPPQVALDHNMYVVATDQPVVLGALSSAVHIAWMLRAGSTLEDRPLWINSTCFAPFPFPSDDTGLTPALADRIRTLAEQLDAHRKARQAAHDDVTLTGLYNVLAKLRAEEPLNAKEKLLHEHGLVAVLKSLHDELDTAVLQAYGWSDLEAALADHRPAPAAAEARAAAVETLLERLVALNAKRAAEEAAGHVRWLRPEFQTRALAREGTGEGAGMGEQTSFETEEPAESAEAAEGAGTTPGGKPAAPGKSSVPATPALPATKRPWPTGLAEQVKTVADVLAAAGRPLALADIEAHFSSRGRWRERLPVILETLTALGRARELEAGQAWLAA